jgi:hypothetical protein
VAERDTLSFSLHPSADFDTANNTLVLFHEAWVMNLYNRSETVTFVSPVTKENFNPSTGYPVFGKSYILQQSLFPNILVPKNVQVLEKPEIMEENNTEYFIWSDITIDPNNAVIIAYANSFGNNSAVYRSDGYNLPGVKILSTFDSDNSILFMNYSITNTGKSAINSPKFIVFFPETVRNIPIFQPEDIIIKSNCKMDIFENTSYNDGSGHFSTGHMMLSQCPEFLDAAQSDNYHIRIQGKELHSGKLIPSIIVRYREDASLFNKTSEERSLSQPDFLSSDNQINITRLYYSEVSLVLPEQNFFSIIPVTSNLPTIQPFFIRT